MFSIEEKQHIAEVIEKTLMDLNHPEMSNKAAPTFLLHVEGEEEWSWADIEPNWKHGENPCKDLNPWNEIARDVMSPTKEDETSTIRKKISSLIEEFRELYHGDLSDDAISLLLTELQKI